MTDDDDPVPLRAGGEAGPELVRALQALKELRPDATRRARVVERLSAGSADAQAGSSKLRVEMTQLTWVALAFALLTLCWLGYQLAR